MQDISVLYLSKSILLPGMGNIVHAHDYWHLSIALCGLVKLPNGIIESPPNCTCTPPGVFHAGCKCIDTLHNVNVMFIAHDKVLHSKLEAFPFSNLNEQQLFLPILLNIVEQSRKLLLSPNCINSAISYYLHLLMDSTYIHTERNPESVTLAEKCIKYIEENYMHPIKVEDISSYIGRNSNYTSHLVKTTTGLSLIDHLNMTRIKNACSQLSYSTTPLDAIAHSCGFQDVRYFCRVFKSITGTTPSRYRTSHAVNDMYYDGNLEELNHKYVDDAYTYIPDARRCIDWETPLAFLTQTAPFE